MKISLIVFLILFVGLTVTSFGLIYNYEGKLDDANVIIEQQTIDYDTEVDGLHSVVTLRNTEIAQLKAQVTAAQELAAYWESKTHLKQFASLEELELWLANNDIDSREYIETTYDCDDFAHDLMIAALEDGYLISTELWSFHMLNSTIIGNDVYTIEPQTDEIQFVGSLD